jgi:hypothetical protein
VGVGVGVGVSLGVDVDLVTVVGRLVVPAARCAAGCLPTSVTAVRIPPTIRRNTTAPAMIRTMGRR